MAGRKKISLEERFFEKVEPVTESGCWLWTGSTNRGGYGQFSMPGRPELAHRMSMRLAGRDVPSGIHVLHKCDTPACVNPDHLFMGTDADNVADMIQKGRARKRYNHGQKHHLAKISDQTAVEIFLAEGKHRAIAERYGVALGTVSHIKSRRQWRQATKDLA